MNENGFEPHLVDEPHLQRYISQYDKSCYKSIFWKIAVIYLILNLECTVKNYFIKVNWTTMVLVIKHYNFIFWSMCLSIDDSIYCIVSFLKFLGIACVLSALVFRLATMLYSVFSFIKTVQCLIYSPQSITKDIWWKKSDWNRKNVQKATMYCLQKFCRQKTHGNIMTNTTKLNIYI